MNPPRFGLRARILAFAFVLVATVALWLWRKPSGAPSGPVTGAAPAAGQTGLKTPVATEAAGSAAKNTTESPVAALLPPPARVDPGAPVDRGGAATPPKFTKPAEPGDEEIDYSRYYITINGRKADPRRLLAKFKTLASIEVRQAVVRPLEWRIKTEFALTPGMVVLDLTSGLPPPVASPEEAKARGEQMQERIKALLATGEFEYVEPDYIHTIRATPNDAGFTNGSLWGLRNTGQENGVSGADIDAVRAWDLTTGSTNVIVAVIDTGIRYTHSDLAPQMWRNPGEIAGNGVDDDGDGYVDNVFGINAVTNSGNPMDDQGHGTHCAGTIGAAANGSGQHVGVAWQVRLMACKFLQADGSGSDSNAIKCINFAVSKGAKILSNSWGGGGSNPALLAAIQAARDRGVLFVAAAGNGGDDGVGDNNDSIPDFPSNYNVDNIISVAALDRQDKLANFSNYGLTTVDIGAPGVSILSTTYESDTSYGYKAGTSMATPHVAGVAALVLARFPAISLAELKQRILDAAVPVTAMRNKSVTGGRLNAFNALSGSPDGVMEVALTPASGTQLIGGVNVPFFLQVTDVLAVTNATVTGTIAGRPPVVFRNDGVAPDEVAGDHIYSASIEIPITSTSLALSIEATAVSKSKSTTNHTFPVRLPPANDNFATRIAIPGPSATVTGSNIGATKEIGEPNHAGFYGGPSVWWTWTAPASGTVTIKTDGSTFDTIMAAYTGTAIFGLTRIAEDDDSGVNRASLVSFEAIGGTTYHIAVDGFNGASGDLSLTLALIATPPPPANDDFANGTVVAAANSTVTGSNLGATKQAGEPSQGGNAGGRSVWWRWTATASGVATLTTEGSLFNTTLGVYTGTDVASLTSIANDNDSGEGSRSLLTFNAVNGTTYHFSVDGFGGASGAVTLKLLLVIPPPTPANDSFASRTLISGASATVTGTNVAATKEASEPSHAGNSGGRSVWWTWTPASSGTAIVTTGGSNFDTLLAVYTGSALADLVLVAGNDQDPAGGNTSRVTFDATAGTTYQIAIDGANTGLTTRTGNITLNVAVTEPSPPAANDNFSNRIAITGTSAVVAGSNVGAGKETGEPRHANSNGGKSVWWAWTAPSNGTATLKTLGSSFDTLLAVYAGTSVSALTTVAQNDDITSGSSSQVKFNAVSGTTYQIAVDGFAGASGSILLNLTVGPVQTPPPNDNFANRTAIAGATANLVAENGAASRETGEPSHADSTASRSLWWTWTAPQTGNVTISTAGSDFDTVLAVYTGSALTSLVERAADDDGPGTSTSIVTLFVTANTTYAIAVDGYGGDSGNIALSLNLVPSNNLYFADFESFTSGSNQLGGTDGWIATGNTLGTTGIFDGWGDGTKTAWIGLNPTSASSVVSWRPINYEPVASGTPNIRFQVDMLIRDSTNDRRDIFYFLLYNIQGAIVSGLAFDNSTLRVRRYDGAAFENVGGFVRDRRYTLTLNFNFESNLWSANLDNIVLFVNRTMAVSGQARTLGDFDVMWQIAQPGSPGNNLMVFDNFRVAIATANDAFADAISLAGATAQPTGSNQGASRENGEPNHAAEPGGSSVWWKWTAPANGTAFIDTRGSNFDTLLGVYTGSSLSSLTSVTANDDEDDTRRTSAVAFTATVGTSYYLAVDGWGGETGAIALNLNFVPGLIPPAMTAQPQSQAANAGGAVTLLASASGSPTYRWQRNGTDVAGATASTLSLTNVQPATSGIYSVIVANAAGSATSQAAIFGLSSTAKLVGLGTEFANIVHPQTQFTYDQILLGGSAATVTADSAQNQILRISYIDLNDDIVQVEFSGPGALSLVLDAASGPAIPAKYNQAVNYMKGHASIVVTGATANTNLSVFSVGTLVNGNPALYKSGVAYDGLSDLAFVAITSTDGKFGGLRSSNTSYFNTKGFTGVYAPGVQFTGPVFVGDISASDTATPVFVLGSGSDVRITGGDLLQGNGQAVQVNGIAQLKFTPGSTSHAGALPAKNNRARLEQNGVDVTTQIVVNPAP